MQNALRLFWSGTRVSFAVYSVELTPAVILGSKIPRWVLQALFFVLIAKAAGGNELAKFALIGNAVHAAVFPAIVELAIVIEVEKWAGTLPHLIAAPANWLPMMIGRSMAGFFDALLSTVLVLVVLVPVIAPDIAVVNLLRAAPLLVITLITTGGLGWLSGSISLPTRWGMLLCNMIGYIMMLTAAVNFPLSALPPAVQWLSRSLPMTHGLLAIRAVVDGAPYSDVMGLMGLEILIGVVYGAAAWLMFRYRLNTARSNGNIELI